MPNAGRPSTHGAWIEMALWSIRVGYLSPMPHDLQAAAAEGDTWNIISHHKRVLKAPPAPCLALPNPSPHTDLPGLALEPSLRPERDRILEDCNGEAQWLITNNGMVRIGLGVDTERE